MGGEHQAEKCEQTTHSTKHILISQNLVIIKRSKRILHRFKEIHRVGRYGPFIVSNSSSKLNPKLTWKQNKT